MTTRNMKLISAALLVGCAIGFFALRVARATPAEGFFTTFIGGPVPMEEIDIKSNIDGQKLRIQTKGEWESRVANIRIVPGGHSGWHSHPGAVLGVVKAGTLTFRYPDGSSAVYPAGTGFVEEVDDVGIASNEGTTDVDIVAFFLTRAGESPRIDEPAP